MALRKMCQFRFFCLLKFDRQNLSSRMIAILELTRGLLILRYLRNVKYYPVM